MAQRPVIARLTWPRAHRLTTSPEAPVTALRDLVDNYDELQVLLEVEGITNPLARDAAGILPSIPADRRYCGPLASLVMAPFLIPRATRFSDGTYGVLYAADCVATALAEVEHHQAAHLADMRAPAGTTLRLYGFTLDVEAELVTVLRGTPGVPKGLYDAASHAAGRRLGRALRAAGHAGIHATSVRRASGTCIGLFWPNLVSSADAASRWMVMWNGTAFEHRAQET